ncbi:MAG: hypothetical protein PWP27_681 [Clostridiales bacterium]|jgi:nitroreductase|nr:hypothetical protein [Clostridiales bacterium]MDK2932871.1 hypothetical protein [Clostridiales bacterium]
MNEVLKTIKSRRSIRKYLPQQIRDSEINTIIEAGIYAATGHNEQPWYFTVIQDKELIDYMSQRTKELMSNESIEWIARIGRNEKRHLFHHAPTVIVVSGKQNAYSPLTDCSAAIQNMMVAAESMDIGSCWIGLVSYFFEQEEEVKKLNIPEGYKPFYAVCFGYKDTSIKVAVPERKTDIVNYIK